MISMRKVLRVLLAVLLMAFALPSGAASTTKYFSAVFPDLVPSGLGVQIPVTIYNATPPPGVSTINSIKIVPPAAVTITNVTPGTKSLQPDGSVIVNNIPGIKTGKSLTFTVTADVNVVATCALATWGAAANAGNAYPQGDEFLQSPTSPSMLTSGLGCDGVLKCPSIASSGSCTADSGCTYTEGIATIARFENKDGSVCKPVLFSLSIDEANRTVRLWWDRSAGGQPTATFETQVQFPPEEIAAGAWPPRTKVCTLDTCSPTDFVEGPTCLSPNPPAPYGKLSSFSGTAYASTGTITIDTTAGGYVTLPQNVDFPIVIGTERMDANCSTATSCTVTRTAPVNGTTQIDLVAAAASQKYVMSTPLPLNTLGLQVAMCISQERLDILFPSSCPSLPAGSSCGQITDWVFDLGDGSIGRAY